MHAFERRDQHACEQWFSLKKLTLFLPTHPYGIVLSSVPPYKGVVCYNILMSAVLHTRAFMYVLRVATGVVVCALWIYTSLTTAFFWTLFLVWAVWRLDSRIIGGGAIALLVLIPILLSVETWAWTAETLAVWVYFLLCITVGLQMLEMMLTSRRVDEFPSEQVHESRDMRNESRGASMRAPNTKYRVSSAGYRVDTNQPSARHSTVPRTHFTALTPRSPVTLAPRTPRLAARSTHVLDLRPQHARRRDS